MMTALLETLDEDTCEAYQHHDHCYHSCMYEGSAIPSSVVDQGSRHSSSEEDEAVTSGEAGYCIECGSAQVAGTSYSNEPSPPIEATLLEASDVASTAGAADKHNAHDSNGANISLVRMPSHPTQAEEVAGFQLLGKLHDSSARHGLPCQKCVVKIIKPEGISMGMSVEQAHEGMLVTGIFVGGLVDLWNQTCQAHERVAELDKIVAANGAEEFDAMLDAITGRGKLH